MRYFFDTEFIEDGKAIDLISIGIICDDGRELYLLNSECNLHKASKWVRDNVLTQLPPKNINYADPSISPKTREESFLWRRKNEIAALVKDFCNPIKYGTPEFWAYYADYDWVVFCQLFGTMMQLPDNYPMFCMDLKQWCVQLGNPRLPKQENGCHNAIEDARWNRNIYYYLSSIR